jgi:nitrous oxidase accessory protein NosD
VLALFAIGSLAGSFTSTALAAPKAPPKPAGGARTSTPLVAPVSSPLNAPQSRSAVAPRIASKDIDSCGEELTVAGSYVVTENLSATGAGEYCFYIDGNGISINLDGHTITGDGSESDQSEYCVYMDGNDDTVANGTLSDCNYGVYLADSVSSALERLTIYAPSYSGIYEEYSAGTHITADKVTDVAGSYGVYLYGGTGTAISQTTATYTSGAPELFYAEYEYGDLFNNDVAELVNEEGAPVTYGGEATGFTEYYDNHDRYISDRSLGNEDGFYLDDDGYGVVSVVGNRAEDYEPTEKASYGSGYDYYVYDGYDDYSEIYPYPKDIVENNVGIGDETGIYAYYNYYGSLFSGNTMTGNYYGFYDYYDNLNAVFTDNKAVDNEYGYYMDDSTSEIYKDNTATDDGSYGYYVEEESRITMIGNIATGTNTAKSFTSDAYGFLFYQKEYYYEPLAFNDNQANRLYYGFYGDDAVPVSGTGNTGVDDEYLTYLVQAQP